MRTANLRALAATLSLCATLHGSRSLQAVEHEFRTDINPALLYFQAFQTAQLSEADANHLFNWSYGEWPDTPLDDRRITLLKQFDNAFKLLRRARFSHVPCDWGYDISDGPEALLPGLAPAKRLSQAARLRAFAALEDDRFDDVREEFAGAFTLARNLARDHILISCLVQDAMEGILSSVIMENYYRFSAEQLGELVRLMDGAPARGTIAETIGASERDAFFGYIHRKVASMVKENAGNDAAFWAKFDKFWNPIATEVDSRTGPDPSAEVVKAAAGGTPEGVLNLLSGLPALYEETARIMALPYGQFKEMSPALFAKFDSSKNPFVRQFFNVFKNVRGKEFAVIVRQEMVRAAAAYKSGGMDALEKVQDPLIGGPFEFTRVVFEGVDRGFRLHAKEQFRDFDEVMIFLEKPGRHFRLDGKNAGKP